MKVLTVKNPWAFLIATGIKNIENRTWRTNFRGRVLIHSAATPSIQYKNQSLLGFYQIGMTEEMILSANESNMNWPSSLKINSEILCSVEIVDCVMDHPSIWAEKGLDKRGKQIWNWVLANPRPEPAYEGLKIKGALSFWDFTKDRIIGEGVSNG